MPRLFDRFERGATGQGSGLAIAKAYANAHGGELPYTSKNGGSLLRADSPARQASEL